MTIATTSKGCQFCTDQSPCALHTPPQPGDKPAPDKLLEMIKTTICERCGALECPISGIPVCKGCFGYCPEIPQRDTDAKRHARAEFARGISDQWHDQPYKSVDASNLPYQLGRQRVVGYWSLRHRERERATSGVQA